MNNYLFIINLICIIMVSLFNDMYIRNENDKKWIPLTILTYILICTCILLK